MWIISLRMFKAFTKDGSSNVEAQYIASLQLHSSESHIAGCKL